MLFRLRPLQESETPSGLWWKWCGGDVSAQLFCNGLSWFNLPKLNYSLMWLDIILTCCFYGCSDASCFILKTSQLSLQCNRTRQVHALSAFSANDDNNNKIIGFKNTCHFQMAHFKQIYWGSYMLTKLKRIILCAGMLDKSSSCISSWQDEFIMMNWGINLVEAIPVCWPTELSHLIPLGRSLKHWNWR